MDKILDDFLEFNGDAHRLLPQLDELKAKLALWQQRQTLTPASFSASDNKPTAREAIARLPQDFAERSPDQLLREIDRIASESGLPAHELLDELEARGLPAQWHPMFGHQVNQQTFDRLFPQSS